MKNSVEIKDGNLKNTRMLWLDVNFIFRDGGIKEYLKLLQDDDYDVKELDQRRANLLIALKKNDPKFMNNIDYGDFSPFNINVINENSFEEIRKKMNEIVWSFYDDKKNRLKK